MISKRALWPGVAAHTFDPSTQTDLWVQGQSGHQSEFQDSQSYEEKHCLSRGGTK